MANLMTGHAFITSQDEQAVLAELRRKNEELTAQLSTAEEQLARTQQQLRQQTGSLGSEFHVMKFKHSTSAYAPPAGSYSCSTQPVHYSVSYSAARIFKVILTGDSGVGKTTFVRQFCLGEFSTGLKSTVGVDFYTKNLIVDDQQVALKVWDTAGTERYRSITKSYMRDADGIILMYDVMDETSFANVHQWMGDIREKVRDSVVVMIVGNKVDLVDERNPNAQVVPKKMGRNIAESYRAHFAELSAKNGDGIAEAASILARALKEAEDDDLEGARKIALELSRQLESEQKPVERNPCC